MKVACGSYMNLYTEIGHEDRSDIDVSLDIYILFAEVCDYDPNFDIYSLEDRVKDAIIKWKEKNYKTGMIDIALKVRKAIENELEDVEVVKVYVSITDW